MSLPIVDYTDIQNIAATTEFNDLFEKYHLVWEDKRIELFKEIRHVNSISKWVSTTKNSISVFYDIESLRIDSSNKRRMCRKGF